MLPVYSPLVTMPTIYWSCVERNDTNLHKTSFYFYLTSDFPIPCSCFHFFFVLWEIKQLKWVVLLQHSLRTPSYHLRMESTLRLVPLGLPLLSLCSRLVGLLIPGFIWRQMSSFVLLLHHHGTHKPRVAKTSGLLYWHTDIIPSLIADHAITGCGPPSSHTTE